MREFVAVVNGLEYALDGNAAPHYSLITTNYSLPVIDLQWFADSDDEDAPGKTEQPSEYKLKRLREEGQIAKSQELTGAVGLLLPALLLLFIAPYMLRTCVEMVQFFFLRAVELDPAKDAIIAGTFFIFLARLVFPIIIVAVISAILSNVVQTNGFLFTTKPITPDFSRVIPRFGQYFKRIFSIDGLVKLGMSLIKIVIIGIVAYLFIKADIGKLLNLQKADVYQGLTLIASIAIRMILVVAFLMFVLAIVDYFFQRWRFRERHKMTRYEQKEERKMYDSDPQIQQRIRARFREMLRQSLTTTVPKADVVITNPTHLAIALQYDERYMHDGPIVVAKGDDEIAARIREIAKQHDIPLVENKPLAWALYRETDVGDVVPRKYIQIVAEIFIKIWRLDEKRRERNIA
jgi:flagellar biosynthesis protein FlhB